MIKRIILTVFLYVLCCCQNKNVDVGSWKALDINAVSNMMDFCYSRSLKKSYEYFYENYNDIPGKLVSVDRQTVEGTKFRLKYNKNNKIIQTEVLCKPWIGGE